jgi:DNA polymerase II small subunit
MVMEDSQNVNLSLKKAISLAFTSGYQLDRESFSLLQELAQEKKLEKVMENVLAYLKELPENPLFITSEMIQKTVKDLYEEDAENSLTIVESIGVTFNPLSKEFPSELEVLADPTETIGSTGDLDDFLKYFQDRFIRIERLLRERLDVKDAITVKEALNAPSKTKVKIIGIVTGIRERRETVFMQIEDLETVATVLISSRADKTVREKAERILLDQVVCVEGVRSQRDLIVATNFINPDIPERKPKTAKKAVYAALLSDLHIGSKYFQEKTFNKFLRWLQGREGNYRQREIASRLKYIIVAGDVVDGVGIFPDQEKELVITDIYEQYDFAAKLIQQIPEYIDVIIIPGNHDATRQALPQPAIKKEYAEPIYEARKVVMIGDPAKIRLNDVEFLLFHGRSLDDIISSVPDVLYRNLDETISTAMKYLLKIRHLAPIYGSKTPIAPETQDFLVIDSVPDVFHAGHVHVFGYEEYRGTLIVNSGSWQSQTPFQEKMGLVPTWGIAPILNLRTLNITPMDFSK